MACADAPPTAAVHRFDGALATVTEELRIDGRAHDLVPVRDLAVRRDGTIAIAQAQDAVVRFFSPSGEPLATFGGEGGGPGEFQNLSRMGWIGDTLWIEDGRLNRITYISPTFELDTIVTDIAPFVQAPPELADRLPASPSAGMRGAGVVGDVFVALAGEPSPDYPDPFMGPTTLGRMRVDGTLEELILDVPANDGQIVTASDGSFAVLPFIQLPLVEIDAGIGRAAVALAARSGADAPTFSLAVARIGGDTIFAGRYAYEGRRIPRAYGDSVIQASIARRSMPELAAAVRREATVPTYFTPINDLVLGTDGSVWLRMLRVEEDQPYSVVGPDGLPVGMLVLPRGSRVAAASLDRIWVIETDEFDFPSIVRYAVQWERSSWAAGLPQRSNDGRTEEDCENEDHHDREADSVGGPGLLRSAIAVAADVSVDRVVDFYWDPPYRHAAIVHRLRRRRFEQRFEFL